MGKSYTVTFYGKVIFFFGLAILMSALGMFLTASYFLQYILINPALIYLLFIVELIIIFTSRLWSQRSPLNKIMFAAFTFITGMTAAPIVAYVAATSGLSVVLRALAATVLTFAAAGLFGWKTEINLSGFRGFLGVSLLGMIIVGLIGIFIPWGNTMELIYSWFGVILFTGYVMFDFQRLKKYPENMYMEAALALYLDIFNLFLFILRIMSSSRR